MTCSDPTATPLADYEMLRCAFTALLECIRAGDREAEAAWQRSVADCYMLRELDFSE